ncbi:tyrosine-type recombinase/integrase [Nocardia sp. NPDC055049]
MSIRVRTRKDGSHYCQVRYRISRGDRDVETSQSFNTWDAADRFEKLVAQLGAAEAEVVLGMQREAATRVVPTVGQVVRAHIETLTNTEEETRRKYGRMVDLDIDPFFGDRPCDSVTRETDTAWVVWLQEVHGNGPKTVKNKHGLLSAAMADAAAQQPKPLIPYNPCVGTRLPKLEPREFDYLTPDEYELMLAVTSARWHPMMEFAVMSMARPSEIAALNVADIDPKEGGVRITKAFKDANGKLKLGAPKSRRGTRTTFVPGETISRLDLSRHRTDPLFHTSTGRVVDVRYWYDKCWVPARKRLEGLAAGDYSGFRPEPTKWRGDRPEVILDRFGHLLEGVLEKQLSPYILRHTGISWRLQDGVPIWVVSRDAGHESIVTTDKQYGHISSTASQAAAATVSDRLPALRSSIVRIEDAARRRLVRQGLLGEIDRVEDGFEGVWMDADGNIESRVFKTFEGAVSHVALHEAGDVATENVA